MYTVWVLPIAIGVIVALVWYAVRRTRIRAERRILKQQVQTWEDEGGNVPDVPVVAPHSSPPEERP